MRVAKRFGRAPSPSHPIVPISYSPSFNQHRKAFSKESNPRPRQAPYSTPLDSAFFFRPKTRVPDNLMQGTTGGGGSGKCRMTSISPLVVEWWDAPRQSPFRNDLVETWRATRQYKSQTPRILNPPKGSYFLHLGLRIWLHGKNMATLVRLYPWASRRNFTQLSLDDLPSKVVMTSTATGNFGCLVCNRGPSSVASWFPLTLLNSHVVKLEGG